MPEFEFINPENLPPEIKEAHNRYQMETEAARHEFQTMLMELPLDHLKVLQNMFHSTGCGDNHLATWFEGIILGIMKVKYNLCMTCMVNHDEEVAEMDTETKEPEPMDDENIVTVHGVQFSETDYSNMTTYHIEDIWDVDTNEFLGFMCTGIQGMKQGCGMRYPSIEDRMLREPESCSGCFAVMGHG